MQPEVTAAVMHLKTMWWPRKSECEAEKEAASTVCSQSRTDSPPDQTSYTHSSVSDQLLTADLLETKSSLLLPLIFYLHQNTKRDVLAQPFHQDQRSMQFSTPLVPQEGFVSFVLSNIFPRSPSPPPSSSQLHLGAPGQGHLAAAPVHHLPAAPGGHLPPNFQPPQPPPPPAG